MQKPLVPPPNAVVILNRPNKNQTTSRQQPPDATVLMLHPKPIHVRRRQRP